MAGQSLTDGIGTQHCKTQQMKGAKIVAGLLLRQRVGTLRFAKNVHLSGPVAYWIRRWSLEPKVASSRPARVISHGLVKPL